MVTQLQPEQTIVSIDTDYLFAATKAYREIWMDTITQTDQIWATQPDQCCAINK
jgi:hypothetical protein